MLTPQNIPELLLGKNFSLRRVWLEQAEELFDIISKDRERLAKFLPWVDEIKSIEDQKFALKNLSRKWEGCEAFNYVVVDTSDRIIGCISAHSLDWQNLKAELGYWLAKDAEGHGYVTAAIKLLEQELFKVGFIRLEIRTRTSNIRSIKTAQQAGFAVDGTLRSDIVIRGESLDTVVLSKIYSKS